MTTTTTVVGTVVGTARARGEGCGETDTDEGFVPHPCEGGHGTIWRLNRDCGHTVYVPESIVSSGGGGASGTKGIGSGSGSGREGRGVRRVSRRVSRRNASVLFGALNPCSSVFPSLPL